VPAGVPLNNSRRSNSSNRLHGPGPCAHRPLAFHLKRINCRYSRSLPSPLGRADEVGIPRVHRSAAESALRSICARSSLVPRKSPLSPVLQQLLLADPNAPMSSSNPPGARTCFLSFSVSRDWKFRTGSAFALCRGEGRGPEAFECSAFPVRPNQTKTPRDL